MTDSNYRTHIFLEADNLSKQKHGVFYNDLPPLLKESIYNVARRNVDAKIREQTKSLEVKP